MKFDHDDSEKYDIPQIKEPEDKGGVAYLLMLLFGIGALLPWNAILTALDFFKEKVSECDITQCHYDINRIHKLVYKNSFLFTHCSLAKILTSI